MIMTTQNKIAFSVEKDGKTYDLAVVKPSIKVQQTAKLSAAKSFADSVKNGVLLEAKLNTFIKEQKVWDEVRELEAKVIRDRITENEKIVSGTVKDTTKLKAKEAAIKLRQDRVELNALTADVDALRSNTVEVRAQDAEFNYYVSQCTVDAKTGYPYFASLEAYENSESDPVTMASARNFATLFYGLDPDFEKKRPENKFLAEYKFCNEKLQLIDEKGRLVDTEGRLINDEGRFVNEGGEYINRKGDLVNKDGEALTEKFAFID